MYICICIYTYMLLNNDERGGFPERAGRTLDTTGQYIAVAEVPPALSLRSSCFSWSLICTGVPRS